MQSTACGLATVCRPAVDVRTLACDVAKKWRRQVTLTKTAHDGDDALALELRSSSDLRRGPHVGTTADASHDAFFLGKSATPLERDFVIDSDDIVDDRSVEVLGNEARADPLNAMLPWLSAADDWRMLGFNRNGFEVWIASLDIARNAVIVPPVPTPATITSIS